MPTAYEKAVQLLTNRPHFRQELRAKLAARNFPAEEVEAALDRLTSQRFLDDRAAAESLIRSRLERGPKGRLRLAAELARRGADPEAAQAALDALVPDDDLEAAREAAARWAGRGGKPGDAPALARHLARKGFSRPAIARLAREAGDESESAGGEGEE